MALLLLLLVADATDAEFLAARVKDLAQRYEQLSSRQAPAAVRERATLVREIAHLPLEDESRDRAGRLLAKIVTGDRSYRVRADAARAIARVGTPEALAAMVRALFGPEGREPRFELLYTVLPEALANLRRPDDLDWIADRILKAAAGGGDRALLAEAGPLEKELVALTLEGVGRARAGALGPFVAPLARAKEPDVRIAAVGALAALGIADAALVEALKDPDERVRAAAAGCAALGPTDLRLACADASLLVRGAAIRTLSACSGPDPVSILVERLAAEDVDRLRLDMADALHDLTGKDFGLEPDLWLSWWSAAKEHWDGPAAPETGERAYFFDVGLRTARVTFVIDVSASMASIDAAGLSRLAYAGDELDRAIRALPPATRFRVLTFAADVRGWPAAGDAPGDRTRSEEAVQALLSQKPAGATNTYAALMTAIEDPFGPDSIVLLTDGSPYRCSFRGRNYSEPEQILCEVKRANAMRGVRIHAVALCSGRDADPADAEAAVDFLRRLAAGNRGEFREVR